MRSSLRVPLLALLVGALVFVVAPAAAQAFGIESFFAANCKEGATCTNESTKKDPSEFYSQASGHPAQGVTEFTLKTIELEKDVFVPEESVQTVRTNVAPGVATNPEAVAKCSVEDFTSTEVEPAKHLYLEPKCAKTGSEDTIIGENKVITAFEFPEKSGHYIDVPLSGKMYNLVQPNGLASYFGIALELPEAFTKGTPLEGIPVFVHTFLEGHVEWGAESPESGKAESQGTGKADYHDVYIIKNITPGLIQSRVVFFGTRGNTGLGGFVTNPSNCSGIGPQTTTGVRVESYGGKTAGAEFTGAVGTEGCNGASPFSSVPFKPAFTLEPETKQQDQPTGLKTELTLPHATSPEDIDASQLKTATVTLPEGMTLNPSAAREVTQSCSPKQARIHSATFGMECPAGSKIGTDTIEVPTLPKESLTGEIFIGGPESGSITKPPYTIYVEGKSERYGVDVRLEGTAEPNESTGQLKVTFANLPEQPFSNAILNFNGGALAPIANPLVCGTATTTTSLVPYIGGFATETPSSTFNVYSNGQEGACPSPLPFSLSQSVVNQSPGYAGAKTSYTLNIQRADGQQYLSQIKTVLPEGLVGLLPTVTKCPEPLAAKGECPEISEIGKVNVAAGAGSSPYGFRGKVFLTGPYNGAPFGLSVVVPAIAGPFNLGNVVTRGTINIEPYTARVVATSSLPTIVGGIPLRIKGVSVEINKQGFLQNPTNCGVFATETTLTGIASLQPGAPTATQTLSTPFQVNNCAALAFKPAAGAATGAKTSKANGASLETTINVPAGDANVKSVVVQLPKQLPSRLTTLQKACPEATFASNPYHCPAGSFVGGVRANTPTLSVKLQGPAILVSHGGRAFPDLDLLLEGEGVRIILVGNTAIKNGITTTTFAAPPDAPVTSITVNLPTGSHSALAANGNLCTSKLVMPTTIVGQNGVTFKQNTTIKVRNCPVQVVGHKTAGNVAYLTVRTYEAGRISGKGGSLATTFRTFKQAQKAASLKVSLSSAGRRRGRPFSAKIRVGFVPKQKGKSTSVTYVTVRFS